jgi:hypothetical protein
MFGSSRIREPAPALDCRGGGQFAFRWLPPSGLEIFIEAARVGWMESCQRSVQDSERHEESSRGHGLTGFARRTGGGEVVLYGEVIYAE